MKHRLLTRRSSAFTLIEIMLVVVIIGILAAVIGPKLSGRTGQAKVSATKTSIGGIQQALGLFEVKAGRFPTTDEGLQALLEKPSDLTDDEYDGPYLKEFPHDAWGEDFIYRSPGEKNEDYDIISKGTDKKEGTEDDIDNTPKEKK